MKKQLMLLLICCAVSHAGNTQSRITGIYRTADDFMHQKLSFPSARHPRLVIRANNDFYLPYITVINGAHKIRYAKDSVFGYRTSDDRVYRFWDGGTYELLNPGEQPLLYRSAVMPGGRGAQPLYSYYYSKGATSFLLPLTLNLVANSFRTDTAFIEQMFGLFHDDNDLAQYDSLHKSYRLSRLYARLRNQ